VRSDDEEKGRGLVSDARWVKGKNGKHRLIEDEVDPTTWKNRRREPEGWRNGARVRR
jgi:hypothetical protein